ncbi:23S rRNA (adenine(1618)-N(6))-methyltransferase RlmF [Maribacter hydrothermalis]|uniref:Ribosomal RNA large subunit methyltransferase F n=1 Tax=Maribacter hydrothermalis TaxID=1836467 RepID=A0A1B7Z4G2_9FLAO|nr:23S rRNA (adenine(1618)-N(6))-methyltransferase RlmF [Maribacter hydrothermalis]APQ17324.1 23S rRNA (adenine(1618)-N(6))-methyltransferase [Maribacter hydrothermalis]OBR37584.1 23S rRNA (adenine(1618)-N(6))-methyltransferase [Maribacter hydrothermalis]
MPNPKKKDSLDKPGLHSRNKHKGRYNLKALRLISPELKEFVVKNKYGNLSIDFFNPYAVKALNKALLISNYSLEFWDIPDGFLCPPIPGRADYIHHIADVLAENNNGVLVRGANIKCLDIGVGANCVYPIIGNSAYGWSFIGSDIDQKAINAAQKTIDMNIDLKGKIELRLQPKPAHIFLGILGSKEKVDLTICNPPFHATQAESEAGTLRKLTNLKKKRVKKAVLNFSGQGGELWTDGGEKRFVLNMINESAQFPKNSAWYSTLVSKHSNLRYFYDRLEKIGAIAHKTTPMGQGNKLSRIIAWTFLTEPEMKTWAGERWKTE